MAFRSTGAFGRAWSPVEATDVHRSLVYESEDCHVYAEEVEHGLDFPPAFTQRWICLSYRVEAAGKIVTIS